MPHVLERPLNLGDQQTQLVKKPYIDDCLKIKMTVFPKNNLGVCTPVYMTQRRELLTEHNLCRNQIKQCNFCINSVPLEAAFFVIFFLYCTIT